MIPMLDMNMFENTLMLFVPTYEAWPASRQHRQGHRTRPSWRNLLHETANFDGPEASARGIGAAKKPGDHTAAEAILAEVADQFENLNQSTNEAMTIRDRLRMSIPNILHADVPVGEDESGNTVHAVHGTNTSSPLSHNTANSLR